MNIVLIPGACHGAWWYAPVVDSLTAWGHGAHALTLPASASEPRRRARRWPRTSRT